jgi:hypothetical protein
MVKGFPAGEFHAFITNVCVPLESFVVSTEALKAPFADGVVRANRVPFSDISRFKYPGASPLMDVVLETMEPLAGDEMVTTVTAAAAATVPEMAQIPSDPAIVRITQASPAMNCLGASCVGAMQPRAAHVGASRLVAEQVIATRVSGARKVACSESMDLIIVNNLCGVRSELFSTGAVCAGPPER